MQPISEHQASSTSFVAWLYPQAPKGTMLCSPKTTVAFAQGISRIASYSIISAGVSREPFAVNAGYTVLQSSTLLSAYIGAYVVCMLARTINQPLRCVKSRRW